MSRKDQKETYPGNQIADAASGAVSTFGRTEVAESESSFKNSLEHSAKRELWLAEQQMERLAENGMKPNDLRCIGFKTPVVFAESANVPENAYVADLYEQVSFPGHLHRQIAEVSNGGKVRLKVGQPPAGP
jgi:hypothetical protein